VETLISAT